MGNSLYNTTEADFATALRLSPPIEDIVDSTYSSSNKLAVESGTEYRLSIGSTARHFKGGFNDNTGVTMMFDITNDKAVYSEIYDTPIIDALPSCIFQPSSASAGECIIRAYVDENSPILHDQAIVGYKGNSPEKMGDIFKYYLGSEAGYDLKNKGIYFTFEFDHNGLLWDMSLLHHLI